MVSNLNESQVIARQDSDIDSDYKESLDFLFSQLPMFSRVGAPAYKPGLDTSISLDNLFGNPHRRFKSIHVGGTNGKGSTSHLLASILQAQGYKTALYTSPHLVDFRERMRVNGKMIPKERVVDFTRRWRESNNSLHPSFFELTMMMAFDWFAEEKVDYAVIEVGMGGRLDSTNIITPLLSVITNISFDHTQFLGDTLPKIASEKAGIIKECIPAVVGEANEETESVFINKGKVVSTEVVLAYKSPMITSSRKDGLKGWEITLSDGNTLFCPLGGDYQLKNFNTVLHAVDRLRNTGIKISDAAVRDGFRDVVTSTGFQGRWTVITENPTVICDTGHNEDGLRYNMGQLRELLAENPEAKLRMVIGFVSDKAVGNILPLFPQEAEYYITQASVPRAMKLPVLENLFRENGIPFNSFPTVKEAYSAALAASAPADIIYIGGSTFIVADFLS